LPAGNEGPVIAAELRSAARNESQLLSPGDSMRAEDRLNALLMLFRGRISQELLDFVGRFIKHGELGLALESLCDYLAENDTPISASEFDEMSSLGNLMHLDTKQIDYLRKLISRTRT
jgi:hypothetical protein